MQLEEGKFYKNRMGEKRGPIKAYDYLARAEASFSDGNWIYRQDGAWAGVPHGPDKLDLIEEWRDEPKSPIQEEVVTKRKLVSGEYGRVTVGEHGYKGSIKTHRTWVSLKFGSQDWNAEELEEASHILAQLAEFLRSEEIK